MSEREPCGWAIATSGPVVRRALGYAVVVGSILTVINHGHCALAGRFDLHCSGMAALTVCVPYVVSTLSSVQAIRCRNEASGCHTGRGAHSAVPEPAPVEQSQTNT